MVYAEKFGGLSVSLAEAGYQQDISTADTHMHNFINYIRKTIGDFNFGGNFWCSPGKK